MSKQNNIVQPLLRTALVISALAAIFMILSRAQTAPRVENPVTSPLTSGQTQVLEIMVRGGYGPRQQTARANIPSILRLITNGTYDCSSAVKIPAIGYESYLPPTGITVVDIPSQKPGTTLVGICSMGMYSFKIRFE